MNKMKTILSAFLVAGICTTCMVGCASSTQVQPQEKIEESVTEKEDFFSMSAKDQVAAYEKMDGETAYETVKNSSSSWCVEAYDLVTKENIKELVIIYENGDGTTSFNLNWPAYGGYEISTIDSIGKLSGTMEVSRVGGDGGYAMCYGTNEDGSEFTTSQRSLPQSSTEITVGTMDFDLYKKSADVVTGEGSDDEKLAALEELGFDEDSSMNLISDYQNWLGRYEISGPNNIQDGVEKAGHTVDKKYGYCGKCAAWKAKGLDLEGGCNQMNTIYSWGTLKASGIVTDTRVETVK